LLREVVEVLQVRVEAEEEVEVFRGEAERSGDELRCGFVVAGLILVSKLTRVIQRLADFENAECAVCAKLGVERMLSQRNCLEGEWGEGGLDEVEAGVPSQRGAVSGGGEGHGKRIARFTGNCTWKERASGIVRDVGRMVAM